MWIGLKLFKIDNFDILSPKLIFYKRSSLYKKSANANGILDSDYLATAYLTPKIPNIAPINAKNIPWMINISDNFLLDIP